MGVPPQVKSATEIRYWWINQLRAGLVRAAAPTLWQHTDDILTSLLGYSASDVEALHKLGALD